MAKIITNGLGIELHGKAGNAVFVQTANGLILRPRTTPKNPRTMAQTANRAHFARAAELYKTLTMPQIMAWRAYALTVTKQDPRGGTPTHPTAYHAFVGLTNKYLQVHPAGTPPLNPPTAPFYGDGITVTAAGSSGQVTFTASGANAANVVTELLLQPLAHLARAPFADKYRPVSFTSFAAGSLSFSASVAPGAVAPAFRFVNSATGQQSGITILTAVLVS